MSAFQLKAMQGKIQRKLIKKQRVIEAASGRQKADLVLKNATYVNVFSNELLTCDIAVANGLIVGLGSYEGEVEYDMTGKIVCPGFVDAHIHLESSLVTPKEFVRATLPHGTTTVITDPHEITERHGHRRHRLHVPGDRGSADRRAVHAAVLRPGHADGRIRRESGLPCHRLVLRLPQSAGSGRDDELLRRHPQRPGGRLEDRRLAGAPQEDRRPRTGPPGQGSGYLRCRRRLFRPRMRHI